MKFIPTEKIPTKTSVQKKAGGLLGGEAFCFESIQLRSQYTSY